MSFGQFSYFFVDSCILLPHPLESMTQACQDFLKDASGRCAVSSSVSSEALGLVDHSYSIVLTTFQTKLRPFLESCGTKELSNKSGRIIADFFQSQKVKLKNDFPSGTNVPNELIGAVENYVAKRLHSLEEGSSIKIDDFLASMVVELSDRRYRLEAPFKSLNPININPHPSVTSQIVLTTKILDEGDTAHLSSAISVQRE